MGHERQVNKEDGQGISQQINDLINRAMIDQKEQQKDKKESAKKEKIDLKEN
jgi:hypothetical protein